MSVTADLVYLMGCALHEIRPATERVNAMDMDALFKVAQWQKVGSMTAMALELCLPSPAEVLGDERWNVWKRLRDGAIRRGVLFDVERERHCAFLEANGIKHMPLKGVILQNLYPRFGMREMADNDILFDSDFREKVYRYMLSDGYFAESYKKEIHDCYYKDPFYNFEFHTMLFSGIPRNGSLKRYYADVWDRAVREESHSFRYRFSENDFYVYFIAHAFKHYDRQGIGIRILADDWILRHVYNPDWKYIERQLEEFGALEFGRMLRSLSAHLLDDPDTAVAGDLPDAEKRMLNYLSDSGAYGSEENITVNRLRHIRAEGYTGRAARVRFVLQRLFPNREHMIMYAPITEKYPILLPGAYVWRLIKSALFRREIIRGELKVLRRIPEKKE